MEDLVILEEGRLDFNPAVFTVEPFRKIRKTKWEFEQLDEEESYQAILGYVFYMADYRSAYMKNYSDEEAERRIKNAHLIPPEWEPDQNIINAIQWWKDYQYTITLDLISKVYNTMQHNAAVIDFLNRSIKEELNRDGETDEKTGKPKKVDSGLLIGLLKDVYNLGKELPKLKANLDELQKQLTVEMSQNSKNRKGGKKINPLEKSSNIEDIVTGDAAGVSERKI